MNWYAALVCTGFTLGVLFLVLYYIGKGMVKVIQLNQWRKHRRDQK